MLEQLKNEKGYTFVYGDDHIEGLFFKVLGTDGALLHFDSRIHNGMLTVESIVAEAEQWGFNISHELVEKVIDYND